MDNNDNQKKDNKDIEYVSYNEEDENGNIQEVYGYYEELEDGKTPEERIEEMREFFNKHHR